MGRDCRAKTRPWQDVSHCSDKEAQVWRDLHGSGGAAIVHAKEIHGVIPVDMCSCGKSHGESNGRVSVVALSRSRSVTEKEKNH